MRSLRMTINRMLKVWDESGYRIYFYSKGDENKVVKAGYKQV